MFLVFQIDSEVSTMGINLRYAVFITSLSILKCTDDCLRNKSEIS